MYDTFKCNNPNCGRKSYYETAGHVESVKQKKIVPVCSHCYYEIKGFEGEHFSRTLEEYLKSLENHDAFLKKRYDFIAKIKKHGQYFNNDEAFKSFSLLEKRFSQELFGIERKRLTDTQVIVLQETLEDWFEEVFPRKLMSKELRCIAMTDRYENSRYEEMCLK